MCDNCSKIFDREIFTNKLITTSIVLVLVLAGITLAHVDGGSTANIDKSTFLEFKGGLKNL